MKIYAYNVLATDDGAMPFEDRIREIFRQDLPDRRRLIGQSMMRLETMTERNGFIFADFVNERTSGGPGIVSATTPIAPIDIEEDENFGEETAMLYDPSTGYAVIQYNHHGPKASSIKNYLQSTRDGGMNAYEFYPKLTATSERELQSLSVVSKIEVSFFIPDLASNDAVATSSVADAIAIARSHGAQHLSLTISNRMGMAVELSKDFANGIWRTFTGDSALRTLTVRGTPEDGSPRETIDLIADRLMHDQSITPGPDRRLPIDDRYNALEVVFNFWTLSNAIP